MRRCVVCGTAISLACESDCAHLFGMTAIFIGCADPLELEPAVVAVVKRSSTLPISFRGVFGRPMISRSEVDAVGLAGEEGASSDGGFSSVFCLRSFFFCFAVFFGIVSVDGRKYGGAGNCWGTAAASDVGAAGKRGA